MLQFVDIARLYDVCSVFMLVQVHSKVHVNFGVCGKNEFLDT